MSEPGAHLEPRPGAAIAASSPRVAALRRALASAAWAGIAAHAVFLPISIAGMQIGLAVAVAAVLGLAASGQRVWTPTFVTLPVALLCAGAVVAIALPWLAGLPPVHTLDLVFWRAFAAPVGVLLALECGREGEDPEAPRRRAVAFLALWAAAAILPSVIAWFQVRTGFDPLYALGLRRLPKRVPAPDAPGRFAAVGFFGWYTRLSYAMMVVATFAAALVLLAPLRRSLRVLFAVSAVAASAAVVLGGSRAAWGALSVGAFALALLAGKRVARVAIPAVVALSLVAGASSPALRARLVRLASPGDANGDREMTWRVCKELVREHPLTGVGFNALGPRIDAYFERFAPGGLTRDRCHDVFYSAWAEGGPLFALAVAAWWALLFRGFLVARRRTDALGAAGTAGALAGLTALFTMSLVHDLIWASEAAFAIGGLVGAGAVLARPRAATPVRAPRGAAGGSTAA